MRMHAAFGGWERRVRSLFLQAFQPCHSRAPASAFCPPYHCLDYQGNKSGAQKAPIVRRALHYQCAFSWARLESSLCKALLFCIAKSIGLAAPVSKPSKVRRPVPPPPPIFWLLMWSFTGSVNTEMHVHSDCKCSYVVPHFEERQHRRQHLLTNRPMRGIYLR